SVEYAAGATVTMPAEPLTLYAVWDEPVTPTTYTLSCDASTIYSVEPEEDNFFTGIVSGSDVSFTVAIIDPLYQLVSVQYKMGEDPVDTLTAVAGVYTIEDITANVTLIVNTELIPVVYNVTFPASPVNYTIEAAEGFEAMEAVNGEFKFIVTPADGYNVAVTYVIGTGAEQTATTVGGVYTITGIDDDVTISVAATEIPKYAVTYDLNGGTVGDAPEETDKAEGATFAAAAMPGDVVAPPDKVFMGWSTSASGSVEYEAGATVTMPGEPLTLYAVWDFELSEESGTWEKGSSGGLVITVLSADYANFNGVSVDGTELVEGTDFTAVSGSTIVTLLPEFLETLGEGDHQVDLEFDTGTVSYTLTIDAEPSDDGDGGSSPDNNVLLAVAAIAVIVICIITYFVFIRKQ
ncbi:MAG: InlB B-repeat-containing protein, partial [Methanomassiliicoccaceae archaeon]|nr:InlB B-repeat-containing protein [Methanomassiliicoccaceae archaeon]